jgi:ABC-type Fe3+ transport system permease subunit
MTLGFFAGLAAAVSLTAALVFVGLTWWQDREERQRPERRRWVTVEETNAKERRAGSVIGLAFTIGAIFTVVILTMFGV